MVTSQDLIDSYKVGLSSGNVAAVSDATNSVFSGPQSSGDLLRQYRENKVKEEPSWYDQTIGSFLYGGAETLGLASRSIGSIIPGDDWFDQAGRNLDEYVKKHPQYAPMEVKDTWDLITNPKALTGRVASGLPYLMGAAALMSAGGVAAAFGTPVAVAGAVGTAGTAAAWGLTAAIESRRGYESALADGQDEGTAELKGSISGIVGTVLNMVPLHKYFKVADGAESSLISALTSKALTQSEAAGLRQAVSSVGAGVAAQLPAALTKREAIHEAAKFLAFQTVVGTLSGSSDDLISLGLYGKPLPKEYFDKVLQSAVTAGVNAEAIGFAFKKGHDVFGKDPLKQFQDLPDPTKLDIPLTKQDFFNKALDQANGDDQYAKQLTNLVDGLVNTHAERNGISVNEAWGKLISNKESDIPKDRLMTASEVGESISKIDQALLDVPAKGMGKDIREQLTGGGDNAKVSREDLMNAGVWDLLNSSRMLTRNDIVKRLHERGSQVAEAFHGPEFASEVTTNLETLQQGIEMLGKAIPKAKTPQEAEQLQGQLQEATQKYKETFDTQFQKSEQTQSNVALMDVPGKAGKSEISKLTWRNVVDENNGKKVMLIDELTNLNGKSLRLAIQSAVDAGVDRVGIVKGDTTNEMVEPFTKTLENLDKTTPVLTTTMGDNDVVMKTLTPKLKSRLFQKMSKDNILQYSGTARLLDTGQALLTAMTGNAGNTFDQLFHIFKGTIEPNDKATLEKYAQVKDGNWTPENEKFATRSFLKYLKDGIAPNAELAGTFDYFRKFVTKTYSSLKSLGKQGELPQDVRNAFDRMFYRDSSPITEKRVELKGVLDELEQLRNPKPQSVTEEPKTVSSVTPISEPSPEEASAKLNKDVLDSASKEKRMMAYKLKDGTVVVAKKATTHADVMNKVLDTKGLEHLANPAEIESSGVVEKGMYRDTYTVNSKPEPLTEGKVQYVDYELPKVTKETETKPQATETSKQESAKATAIDPKLQIQLLEKRAEAVRGELRALQSQSLRPRELSEPQRIAKLHEGLQESVSTPSETFLRKNAREAWTGIKTWLVSAGADLERTYGGRKQLETLGQVDVEKKMFAGSHELERVAVNNSLTEQDKKWLANDISVADKGEATGMSLHRALTDKGGVPEVLRDRLEKLTAGGLTEGLSKYVAFHKKIWQDSTEQAVKLRAMRKIGDEVVPVKLSDRPSSPRMLTQQGYDIIRTQGGEAYKKLISKIVEWNPGLTFDSVTSDLERTYGLAQSQERDFGALEHTRGIKYMPDFVQLGDGEVRQIMHTEPVGTTQRTIDRYGQRLGWIKWIGQGLLKDATLPQLTSLLNAVGVVTEKGQLVATEFGKTLLNDLNLEKTKNGFTVNKDMEYLKQKLFDQGYVAEGKRGDIYQQAEALGLATKLNNADVLEILRKVDASKLGEKEFRQLKLVGKDLGGVDTKNTNPQKLFSDLMERAETEYPEYLVDKLRRMHVQEGGNASQFNQVNALAQGIPLYTQSQNILAKTGRMAANLLGAAQTSLAAIPNMTQTMTQLPQLGGAKAYIDSVRRVLTSPELVRSDLLVHGAFRDAVLYWSREPGLTMDEAGRLMKQSIAAGTLQTKMATFNNLVAGEVGRRMADFWNENHSADPGESRKMKWLGLTDGERAEIANGQMSDRTYSKIVQQTVAKTQFVTEAHYLKSKLEINPITSSLFNYMSYATGTIKANLNVAQDFMAGIKSGDPAQIFSGVKRLTLLTAGLYGAGTASMVLRQAVKGDFRQLKKDVNEDKLFAALNEAGLLGPVQRTLSSFDLSGNSVDKAFLGMFPHLSALADAVSVGLGKGKFADFTFSRRLEEAFFKNTPIAKAMRNWYTETAYPEIVDYNDARQRVSQFNQKIRGSENQVVETQLNADHYPTAESIMRGDLEGGIEERNKFFKGIIEQGKDPNAEMEKLRLSLTSRAPMAVQAQYLPQFMASLPPEQRSKVLREHLKYMALVNTVAPN